MKWSFFSLPDYIKNEVPKWPNSINKILVELNVFGPWIYGVGYVKAVKRRNDSSQVDMLLRIINYAIKHVPYYKNKYGNLQISSREEFFQKIHFIDKDEVMNNWTDFISDEIKWDKVVIGTTGGTSGKSLKLVIPKNRFAHELCYIHTIWKRFGWNYDIRAVIRNHSLPSNRDYMINPFTKELIFDAFRMDEKYVLKIVDILNKMNVRFVHAYPSAFYQFLKICHQAHIATLPIKVLFATSEKVTDFQRAYISHFNIEICSFYGHSEKLVLAGDTFNGNGYKIEESYGLFELVDEEGQIINNIGLRGEIVGTTFTNYYFPLIRYKTGDYSQYQSLGDVRIIPSVEGRWNLSLIYKNDGTTTSTTALNLHGIFYEHIDGLQYIQEKKGFLMVLIIKNGSYTKLDEDFILRHIGKAMGGVEYVTIQYVDKLIFQPNGKFLPFIQRCK